MISPDEIPFIPGLLLALLASAACFLIPIRHAKPDPDPRWSQLDCWDGLDSRTDEVRHG